MKDLIGEKIIEAVKLVYPKVEIPDFNIEAADEKFGDYSTNAAMILAKGIGESPQDVAHNIINRIEKDEVIEEASVAGPGFINFKLSLPYLQQKISEIINAGESYGHSDLGQDLKVNLEFISANPTGPLTLGNGRGGYTGDVLANVLEAFGANVEREYYINDRGAQILALGHSVLKDAEAVYKGAYIDEIAPKISSKEPMMAGQEAAAILVEESIKKTIQKMGIKFDHWSSESHLFQGPVEEVMGLLTKNDLIYRQEGAQWLKTTKFSDDKDRVLVTSKGEYTYLTADLAYHYLKIKRGYNTLIDIWGADHHGYIGRMKAGVQILEEELKAGVNFQILIAQLVRLMSKGQEVKMSKRAGTYVTLDELIDEVGADVTRFFFLERSLDTHMDFDLDLAKERSEKNPVYYIQYAHARIHSILAKSKIKDQRSKSDLDLIKDPAELSLIKELVKLPDVVIETAEDYQVQRLPFYAIGLANKFHNFYEHCKVISDDENLTSARLELIKATQIVLKKTLDLMGVSAPEKM
jgi:arginyl-tRNA synthetase